MIFTHLAAFSFFGGAGGSVTVSAEGGAADRKRPVRWGQVGGRYVAVESDTELERLRNRYARHRDKPEVKAKIPEPKRGPVEARSGHDQAYVNPRILEPPPVPTWDTKPRDDSGSFHILAELERSLHRRRMRRRQQEEEALLLLLDD